MSKATPPLSVHPAAAGHLYVRLATRDVDVPFSFERRPDRIGHAVIASFASHAAMFLLMVLVIRFGSHAVSARGLVPFESQHRIVWLSQPGPGGGGGGGGNRMEAPTRQAEEAGKDQITVPVSKPAKLQPPKTTNEPAIQQMQVPAKSLAAAADSLPGALEAPPAPSSLSQGSGSGGGAGTGSGGGIGSGDGSGLGPGFDHGTGGGAFRPGNGVTLPTLLREVRPNYTSDAMRAKIQGKVLVECVVNTRGEIEGARVVQSLDPTFGLDQEALKAARQWRFSPGLRLGEPVPVLITIELSFTLR